MLRCLQLAMFTCSHAKPDDMPCSPAAACVSRTWHTAVQSTPELFKLVSLTGTAITTTKLKTLAGTGQWGCLEELNIAGCTQLGDAGLKVWLVSLWQDGA